MKKFEYKIIDLPDSQSIEAATEQFNALGAEGWEVWQTVPIVATNPPMVRLWMKREIETNKVA